MPKTKLPCQFPNERAFQRAVEDLAVVQGWLIHFSIDSRRGSKTQTPGFPDLILGREDGVGNKVIFAELKMPGNKPNVEQQRWHTLLSGNGLQVEVWYPKDWPDILDILIRG